MKPKGPLAFIGALFALAPGTPPSAQAAGTDPVRAAASASGAISGRVSNAATQLNLEGATVRIDGRGLAAVTDREGRFEIANVPVGAANLAVTYTGLDSHLAPIDVRPGRNVVPEIKLTSQIYVLEKYTVAGIREGNALAIQMQRQSTNIKTVAATDTFGNPAANPGELLQRLPGITTDVTGGEVRFVQIRGMSPTFSSLMVDGNQVASSTGNNSNREVQIEQYGTTSIETVEVIKAPTPDMDASAIAGYINLITKRAFDRPPGRKIDLTLGTLWKARENGDAPEQDRPGLDLVALSYSDVFSVFGRQNNLGVSVNGLRRVTSNMLDEIVHSYSFTGVTSADSPVRQTGFSVREAHNPVYLHALGASVDYKVSEDAYAYARFTFNKNVAYQENREILVTAGTSAASYEPAFDYNYSKSRAVAASRVTSHRYVQDKHSVNYSTDLGGEVNLFGGAGKLNYGGAFSHATIWYPNWTNFQAEVTGVGWELERRAGGDAWYPDFRQHAGPDIHDPANYRVTTHTLTRWSTENDLASLKVDFKRNFESAAPAFLKAGLKYARNDVDSDGNFDNRTFIGADRSILPFLDPKAQDYKLAGGRYGPFPYLAPPTKGGPGDVMDSNPALWRKDYYTSTANSLMSDVIFSETIKSGYLLGNVDIGRLRILGGVRVEDTKTEGTSNARAVTLAEQQRRAQWVGPVSDEENLRRALAEFSTGQVTNSGSYRKVFPGIHFVYEPWDAFKVRASYNNSISRPPPSQLVPGFNVDEQNRTITIGNPNLRPFFSENFELAFDRYFEPVGQVGIGFFLKEISDYSQPTITQVPAGNDNGFDGSYVGWQQTSSMNTGDARVRGIELSYQQQFSFLPGFWRGLGGFANYTYQQTQGTYGGNVFQTRLAGFTPRSGNAGISYVRHGFQGRVMANWRGLDYRSGTGVNTLYREGRTTIDVKLQYTFNPRYDVYLDVGNVSMVSTRSEVREFGRKGTQHMQAMGFSAGVKGRF